MSSTEDRPEGQSFSSRELRDALGQFCTGITVITAVDEGAPVGFACQSLSASALDRSLVPFAHMKTWGSWKGIERAGKFCVDILSAEQESGISTFGRRGDDKFVTIDWTPSSMGSPVIAGEMEWLDCTIVQ